MIGIYKITSPNKKVYIGQSVNIERRFKWHKKNTISTKGKLANSFKKYGVDKHLFEVVEECLVDELNSKERYYQELFSVIGKNGLNLLLTKTSDKSGFASIELRQRLSDMKKGKKHSAERRLANSLSKIGVKHPEYRKQLNRMARLGKKESEETKERKRISGLKANQNDDVRYACGKLILNTQTGIYYLGLIPACESIGIKRSTLSAYLNGRCKNKTYFIRV